MVPFDGQGLNSALEDVRILTILLRRAQEAAAEKSHFGRDTSAISQVLDQYSECRHSDVVAISDLSMKSQ